jgi:16S rRNA (cytidine1402-2'-O)-methyltransferase
MLTLLPNVLDESLDAIHFLPPPIASVIGALNGLYAESEKVGRRFLKRFIPQFDRLPLRLINEHTASHEWEELLQPVCEKKEHWGLISDCGLPCIADPGSLAVQRVRASGG